MPRGFIRGFVWGAVGGALWVLLAGRKGRLAAIRLLVRRAAWIPFPFSRLYARLAGMLVGPVYAAIARDVAAQGVQGDLLELAADTGHLAVEIGKRARDLRISVLDLSGDMVQLAERLVHSAGLGRQVKVYMGNPDEIPFSDGSFDFVVSLGLRHFRSPDALLAEIHRVLRPGGWLWVYNLRRDAADGEWERLRGSMLVPARILFDVALEVALSVAHPESELRALAAASPFGRGEIVSLPIEHAGSRYDLLTRMTLHT